MTLFDESKAAETFAGIDIDTGELDGQQYTVGFLMQLFNSFALREMMIQYAPRGERQKSPPSRVRG